MSTDRFALSVAAALLLSLAPPAQAQVTIPLATATGGAAVYYNDNGVGEVATNAAYVRAQFSLTNTNGAVLDFDSTPLPGTGGALSFFDLFQASPGQFGADLIAEAPTSDGTVPTPTLTAFDNGDNTLAGAVPAGPVDWAISGYSGPGGSGPADSANGIINSLFRGGNGDGSSLSVTLGPVQQNGSLFTVDFELELVSDGLIHWYTLGTPDSPVGDFELTGRLFASGTLTYDAQGPGETSTNLVDFYAGTVTISAEVVCGDRFVSGSGVDFPGGTGFNDCRDSASPCRTIQRTVDISCPGETIFVDPGLYAESIVIDRPVSLLATSPATEANAGDTSAQAVIDGSGAIDTILVADGVSGVSIDGFEVTNPTHAGADTGPAGIRVQSDDAGGATVDVTVTNNVIHAISDPTRTQAKFGEVGVLAFNVGAGTEIRGNTIFDLADAAAPTFPGESPGSGRAQGILVKSSNGAAGGVLIAENVIHDVQDVGIRWNSVSGTPSATVRDNRISAIGSAGLGGLSGLGIDHIGGGSITGNRISTVTGGLGVGIEVSGATLVRGNSLRDIAGGNGALPPNFFPGSALLLLTDAVAVEDNLIDGNAIGITVAPSVAAGVRATANCIQGNGGGGLLNGSSSAVDAIGNWWGSPTGPGGDAPGLGDAVLDVAGGAIAAVPFATTAVCSQVGALNVTAARIARNRSGDPASPSGRLVAKGDLLVDLAAGSIDPGTGFALRLRDALGLDTASLATPPAWTGAECSVRTHSPTGVIQRIRCRTADRRAKLVLRAVKPFVPGGLQTYRFSASVRGLAIDAPFAAPISVDLREGSDTGAIRVGVIHDCRANATGLRCREG